MFINFLYCILVLVLHTTDPRIDDIVIYKITVAYFNFHSCTTPPTRFTKFVNEQDPGLVKITV